MAPYKQSHYVTPRTMNQAFGPYARLDVEPMGFFAVLKVEFWRMVYGIGL